MPTIDELVGSLTLEPAGEHRYTAPNAGTERPVIFGGQLMGQAIVAGLIGHEGKTVKTVHTVFARAGNAAAPVEITVDPVNSGRTFSSTTVTISQGDRIISRSSVLLSADEPDFILHSGRAPAVPAAEECEVGGEPGGGWEVRIVGDVDLMDPDDVGPAELDVWSRFPEAPEDPAISQALLAYATDGFLIGTAMRPHAGVSQVEAHKSIATSVVSHTLTFHEPFSASQWLLLAQRSDYAGRGRCYGHGDIFRGDGVLVASFVQDGMIRSVDPSQPGAPR